MNLKMNKTNSCLIQSDKNNEFDSSKVKNPPESETQEELTENENAVDPENGDDYQDNRIPETACIPEVSDTPETTVNPEESVKTESSLSDISQDPAPSTETFYEERDLTDKDAFDSFKDEVAEYSYEITASATAYTTMDTTGGVDVAFFRTDRKKAHLGIPFKVNQMFIDDGISLVDGNNKSIKASLDNPQYNIEKSPPRKEPSAVKIIRNGNRNLGCFVEFIRNGTSKDDSRYLVWGVCRLSDNSSFTVFQTTGKFVFRKNRKKAYYIFAPGSGDMYIPPFIQKIESIKWYCTSINGAIMDDNALLIDETTNPIYVVLNKPVGCQKKPRTDVLDIACEVSAGAKTEDSIRDKMASDLWQYFNNHGYVYDGGKSHVWYKYPYPPFIYSCPLEFELTQFIKDKSGDCKDASSFAQICCNSLGVRQKLVAITAEKLPNGSDWSIETTLLKGFGLDEYSLFCFECHQVNRKPNAKIVYDPTCNFKSYGVVSNMSYEDYWTIIVSPRWYRKLVWHFPREVILISK